MKIRMVTIILLQMCLCFALRAQDPLQNECAENLKQAQDLLAEDDTGAATRMVLACLQSESLSVEEQTDAYQLLAGILVAQGDRAGAKKAFMEMLKLQPLTVPDPEKDDPEVIEVFNEAQTEFFAGSANPPGSKSRDWPWIVVGGVVVGTMLLLML